MGIVHKRVVVALTGTLPSQHHLVIVALVAHHQGIIAVYFGSVGQAHGAVGIARVDHTCIGIDGLGLVNFSQTFSGHFHGHGSLAVRIVVGNGKVTVRLFPGGHGVLTGSIGEDF